MTTITTTTTRTISLTTELTLQGFAWIAQGSGRDGFEKITTMMHDHDMTREGNAKKALEVFIEAHRDAWSDFLIAPCDAIGSVSVAVEVTQ